VNPALAVAAGLTVLVAAAHSYLGERYVLTRLFRRDSLPKLLGGTEFTKLVLRFAWHLTSVAWLGFGALLLALAAGPPTPATLRAIVAVTFAIHALITLVVSRGRHLAWIAFLAIAALAWIG
jgi:hypothetical protein